MREKIWDMFPRLVERVWTDHAEAGMLGGHHDPDHAIRVGQMAMDIAEESWTSILAGAAGLVHNADRIMQKRLGVDHRDVPKDKVAALVRTQLSQSISEMLMSESHIKTVVDAVLKHNGRNSNDDSDVLVALMDADRLVNAEPDLIIRCGQHYYELPHVDPVHFDKDPTANYRDPKSVLRDIMETLEWLTPGTPFYVRLPKAKEMAAERRKFFDDFLADLIGCRLKTGFHPYPPELVALRNKFAAVATTK